ncbi:MAG TPA: bi-domain-containing oxidoreductase [Nocardioides sp.]|nr:bi-domain-containing oxidoreductase [Nocardioides sp.]
MKQVAQNYRSGELSVLDVPPPACKPGGVLIATTHSLISTGTEMMKVSEARLSLLGKAKARPDQVRKLLDSVAQQGALATYHKAMGKLDSYTPLGYSLCGVVVEVGAGAEEFEVGDVVAAAGNEFALHAELNWVPTNLCVKVPAGIASEHAAFATVGAIAMQGVRRAEPQLGELACVIGLGLIGQLVVRLLVSSGVRVVGFDTVPDRCRLAEKGGAMVCAAPDPEGVATVERAVGEATGGLGCDHVLLSAGGRSNKPVELAVKLARDRGRVVDIGKTKLDLPWNSYYEKELDVRFSRSYGPGRYDDTYELDGVDYPAGYVRWTERRNLQCFLDLIAGDQLDIASLVSGVFPIEQATTAYSQLADGTLSGVGYLLEYPRPDVARHENRVSVSAVETTTVRPRHDEVRVGFIGAGNYASSMLLPHLAQHPKVRLASVATTRSLSAVNAQYKFGFEHAHTDTEALLADDSLDAVFVVTRHASHADLVCRALRAGKAVFVEKPLALSEEQVEQVLATVAETGNDRLMVGFNRRFAPLFGHLREQVRRNDAPVSARYLVNAGGLAQDSWYLKTATEGSRFAGEGGHFIDTLTALVGHDPVEVLGHTGSAGDVQVSLRYPDGSLGSITYATGGHRRFPKETLDVTGGGANGRLDNFTRATVWSPQGRGTKRSLTGQDKGQAAEVAAFVRAVQRAEPMPIRLDSLVTTTRATLRAESSSGRGAAL